MSRKLRVAPSDIQLEQVDAPLVLEFFEHLQTDRRNSSRTRNARLAAIRSFMRFVEHRVPSVLDQVRRVRAIPAQKSDTRLIGHLSLEQQVDVGGLGSGSDTPAPSRRCGLPRLCGPDGTSTRQKNGAHSPPSA